MNLKLRNSLLLLLTAAVWGVSFVSQSVGMDYLGPFAFNGIRLLMGGCVLIPVIIIKDKIREQSPQADINSPCPSIMREAPRTLRVRAESRSDLPCRELRIRRRLCRMRSPEEFPIRQKKSASPDETQTGQANLKGGILCGICLFVASSLQQIGIQYTTAGKSGFITAFYIILVPVISLALGRKISKIIWLAVAVALTGLYLISIKEGLTIGKGDFLTLLCAFVFAMHILTIDHFLPYVDGVRMACIQFFTAGLISMIFVPFLEADRFSAASVLAAWLPLGYSGIFSAGIGYTLQIIGQEGLNPSVASLLMSMESCISAIAGWLILGQAMTPREFAGCALMMTAIIMADFLPFFSERDRNRHSRKSVTG